MAVVSQQVQVCSDGVRTSYPIATTSEESDLGAQIFQESDLDHKQHITNTTWHQVHNQLRSRIHSQHSTLFPSL